MASLRNLVASCALSSLLMAATSHAQPAATRTTEIAPQPLAQALASYANQTGLQLVYVSRIVAAQESKGARPGLSLPDALTELLDGTGLRFEFLNDRTVRIYAAATVQPAALRVTSAAMQTAENRTTARPTSLGANVVTATRREERANRVPISMTVWSQEAMEESGVKGMTEIGAMTPGVDFGYTPTLGADWHTILAIRGVVERHGPSTGVFVDDTPILPARTDTFGRSFPWSFDLDRVEVLRGPQGILLGSGTESGAIRFIPNQPNLKTFSGLVRADWAATARGDLSHEIGAAMGGPVVPEVLGFRVSGWYRSEGGYIDRVDPFTGATVEANANRLVGKSARAALTWAPTASLRVTPSVTYDSYRLGGPSSYYPDLSDPSAGELRNGSLVDQPLDDTFYLGSLKLTADFASATLSSVTSHFQRTIGLTMDWSTDYPVDYSDILLIPGEVTQRVLSQEVRLTSADSNAALTWIVGVFYSAERKREASSIVPSLDLTNSQGSTLMDQTQIEAFGQVGRKITEHLTATAGLRVGRSIRDAVTEVPPITRTGAANSSVIPRLEFSYRSEAGHLFYFTVAKGYRIGGFSPPVADFVDTLDLLPPETIWSYEIGAKTDLLGGRLHIEPSIFHMVWSNDPPDYACGSPCDAPGVRTAAVSNGFDLAAQVVFTDRLSMALGVAFIDSHYTRTIKVGDMVVLRSGDALGAPPEVISPLNISASVDYQFPLSRDIEVELSADDNFHSRSPGPFYSDNPVSEFYDPNGLPNPSTNVLNLRANLRWRSFDLAWYANNALDSQPEMGRMTGCATWCAVPHAITFRPRTVGVTANWKF